MFDGLGVVAIGDTLREFNTAGVVDELPPFVSPSIMKDCDCRIALFHGTINRSKMQNGREMGSEKGYPIEWFNGYDIVALGDNHKQQLNTYEWSPEKSCIWGYPGSLVQQDYGEPLFGHGYILWDIENKTGTIHHVPNDYGAVTVIGKRIRVDIHDYRDLNEALHESWFPKFAKVRVVSRPNDIINETTILSEMREAGVTPSRTNVVTSFGKTLHDDVDAEQNDQSTFGNQLDQLLRFNDPSLWCAFVDAVSMGVADWLHEPRRMLIPHTDALPKSLREKIEKRNGDITKYIEEYEHARGGAMRSRHLIALKHMYWSYIMCYGRGNHFDFESMDGKVCLLNGQNAAGKSSFLDAICIGLYGEPTACRIDQNATTLSGGFIHRQKPITNREQAEVRIIISVDDVLYEVKRSFTAREKDNEIKKQPRICTVHRLDGTDMHLVADGTTTVKEWVKTRLGCKDELLMGVMLSQFDVVSFVDRSAEEQRQYLEKALSIDVITSYERVLKEAYNAYKMVRKEVADIAASYGPTSTDTTSLSIEQIDTMQQQLASIDADIVSRQKTIDNLISIVGANNNKIGDDTDFISESDRSSIHLIDSSTFATDFAILSHRMEEHRKKGATLLHTDCASSLSDAKREYEKVLSEEPVRSQMSRQYVEERLSSLELQLDDNIIDDIDIDIKIHLKDTEQCLSNVMKNAVQAPPSAVRVNCVEKPCADTLENARKAHSSARIAHEAILQKEPVKTRPREQLEEVLSTYSEWLSRFPEEWRNAPSIAQKLLREQVAALSSVNKLLTKHLRNPVSRVDVKQEEAKWQGVGTLDELRTQIITYKDKLRTIQNTARAKNGYDEWKRKWAEWKEKVATVPNKTVDTLRSDREEVAAKLAKASSKSIKRYQYESIVASTQDELTAMEEIPFNPECWACCKQPQRIRRELLQSKLAEAVEQLKDIEDIDVKVDTYKQELERIDTAIRLLEWYESNITIMESEKTAWDISRKQWKEAAAIEDDLSAMRATAWQMWDTECQCLQSRVDEIQTTVSLLSDFCEGYDTKNKERIAAMDELDKCDAYTEWLKEKASSETTLTTAWCLEWTIWDAYVKILQDDIRKMRISIETRELKDALRILNVWEAWNDRIEAAHNILATARWYVDDIELRTKYAVYASYLRDRITELANMRTAQEIDVTKSNSLRVELARAQQALEQQMERKHKYDAIETLRIKYAASESQLERLQERFIGASTKGATGGFKEHVYKEHMLPIVQTEVNSFLAAIDGFRLNIKYADRKLLFFVEDRGNTAPIRLASGYQRFLLGLAIRATLCRIGALGGNMGFLIIDEGFVSLDIDNMGKIRDILDALIAVGGYNMVLMTSHLESIRDTAQMFINIERPLQSAFSRLAWGKPYPLFNDKEPTETETTSKPKRGRKAKVVV